MHDDIVSAFVEICNHVTSSIPRTRDNQNWFSLRQFYRLWYRLNFLISKTNFCLTSRVRSYHTTRMYWTLQSKVHEWWSSNKESLKYLNFGPIEHDQLVILINQMEDFHESYANEFFVREKNGISEDHYIRSLKGRFRDFTHHQFNVCDIRYVV